MVFRLKTSKKTMEIFDKINGSHHLQPFSLAKISLALAVHAQYKYTGELADTLGIDLNRQTITGEYDLLFKKLIEKNEGRSLTEDEYFPNYVKSYLDYGATLLDGENRSSDDLYCHLVELDADKKNINKLI